MKKGKCEGLPVVTPGQLAGAAGGRGTGQGYIFSRKFRKEES